MGRTDGSYGEDAFRSHLLGALKWTTGMVRGDCQATIASNYKIERLTAAAATAGQLDQIGEPHGLTIAPDGTVFYVGKAACPGNAGRSTTGRTRTSACGCGTIHPWDPVTKQVKLLTSAGRDGQPRQRRRAGQERGGPARHRARPEVRRERLALRLLDAARRRSTGTSGSASGPISRLTYDQATNQTIDQATRKDLLQWPVQIHSCCHAGGGMAFDTKGNLYVGSGDNNSSGGSDGYSGNNWTAGVRQGISFQDARRTAGNTNDLDGKIIRIHPEAGRHLHDPRGQPVPGAERPATRPGRRST